jgi:hypothetical protein
MSEFKKGDRLRVTTEVEVVDPTPIHRNGLTALRAILDGGVVDVVITPSSSIQKIEPPVETFQPGDRIRRKLTDGWTLPYEITVADGGYLHHHGNGEVTWTPGPARFTSRSYEKVNLAEVPF